MSASKLFLLFVCAGSVFAGCSTAPSPQGDKPPAQATGKPPASQAFVLPADLQERILALDPNRVTEQDVRGVLSHAPAPRLINIHGGILPIHSTMNSFSEFLMGMGYPRASIYNPADSSYTFGYYESSEIIAGLAAWYYERDGLRPMIVGNSQGGFLAVKVLYQLAGGFGEKIPVFNPITWKAEERHDIVDPLDGRTRPVVGLRLSYAAAVESGGLARFLPNQWEMWTRLRTIPDSVEEFTGFYKGFDPLGGDNFGYGPLNHYRPAGSTVIRNVRLPTAYWHGYIPDTKHLLKSQAIMDWINSYQPSVETPESDPLFDSDSINILWAADVWWSIKRCWVVELQRLIRARRAREESGG